MALIECSECKKSISSKAKTCPECGAPVKQAQNTALGCLGLIMIGGCIALFVTSGPKAPPETAEDHRTPLEGLCETYIL